MKSEAWTERRPQNAILQPEPVFLNVKRIVRDQLAEVLTQSGVWCILMSTEFARLVCTQGEDSGNPMRRLLNIFVGNSKASCTGVFALMRSPRAARFDARGVLPMRVWCRREDRALCA